MHIIPVLDLKGGVVVHGIAGRRDEYRPIRSALTPSSHPVDVARAFRNVFGLTHLYLADLDAIAGAAPALSLYAELAGLGFRLWIDAGVRTAADARTLATAVVAGIVVGLETVAGPAALEEIGRQFGPRRIMFSLDLKNGVPLGDRTAWGDADALGIAERAVAAGVEHLIVLDLARVGVGSGTGTDELCRQLATKYPGIEIVAGGGIRGIEDLRRLQQCGVRGALVASALHDGRLGREELDRLALRPVP